MSRIRDAIEAAEDSYVEEIGTLKQIRDDLLKETRDLRDMLRGSTQVCSRNTFMLGLCVSELRARGMATDELEKMLAIVGQPEIKNELRPAKEVMNLLERVGAPKTISTQVALCDEALAGVQASRGMCVQVIQKAHAAKDSP